MSHYNIYGYKRPSTANSVRRSSTKQICSLLQPENMNQQQEKNKYRPSSSVLVRKEIANRNNRSSLNQLLSTEQIPQNQPHFLKRNNSARQLPHPYTSNEESFLKQEMQLCRAKNQLTKEIDKNQEYFNHLQGKCLCTMCTCGQCKCQFGYKKDKQSLIQKPLINSISQYKSQYLKHPKGIKNLSFNPNQAHPSMKLFSPTSLDKSNYKSTYVRPESGKTKKIEPNNKLTYGMDPQFISKTQYQNAYKNWNDSPQELQKHHYTKTVIQQPFKGESIYKHVYKEHQVPKDREDTKIIELARQPFFKSPINPQISMNYFTQAQESFYPKKNRYGNFLANQQYLPASFPLLCRTTYQADFGKKNNQCPAKQFMYQKKNQTIK